MLHEFIGRHHDEIVARCRAKVAARAVPQETGAEINPGVSLFLDQLTGALRLGVPSSAEIGQTALQHGHDLLRQGFTVSQVVHDYGDICQSITELAVELNAPISTTDFRTLNQCLDDAIAAAVTEHCRERNQSTLEGEVARGTERLGFLAHELRNLTDTALVSFEVLQTGRVGVAGSIGMILQRSLKSLAVLISGALEEVRLTRNLGHPEQILVSRFIDDIAPSAALMAGARGVALTVAAVEEGVAIEADREILTAVIGNLLQNAFKFTRPGTTVVLRVGAGAERVLIEIQDECGGIPSADLSGLFDPFKQGRDDRTGLGLGLAFSRWGVEANHGRIYARNVPESGCIFTVDLPRVAAIG
jgi:signal transduction histidine kinase